MSNVLIATRQENTNISVNQKMQQELDCEFLPLKASDLISAFKEKQAKLIVFYLNGLSSNEELEILKFLANSNSIPVILAGSKERLSGFYEKTKANVMRYIATPILLSDYILEIKRILHKVDPVNCENPDAVEVVESEEIKVAPPKNILVIDDDIVTLRTINNWLSEFFKVSLARSCAEAMKFLTNNTPDLILLDYDMPEVDGIQTLKQIRAVDQLKNVPVFFLTGINDDELVIQALTLKPQGYILKSKGSEYLLSKIQQYL